MYFSCSKRSIIKLLLEVLNSNSRKNGFSSVLFIINLALILELRYAVQIYMGNSL